MTIGARSTIMLLVTLTSNVKFLKAGGTILASPTAKLRGARPTAKLRGLNKTSQNAKFEHFDNFISGQNYTNQNVAGVLQKGTVQANTASRARSAIMFFVTLTSNVKFLKAGGTTFGMSCPFGAHDLAQYAWRPSCPPYGC